MIRFYIVALSLIIAAIFTVYETSNFSFSNSLPDFHTHGTFLSKQPPKKFDLARLREAWRIRIFATQEICKCIPIIDIESNIGSLNGLQMKTLKEDMDRSGISLLGYSFNMDIRDESYLHEDWRLITRLAIENNPSYFFPVTVAGKINRHEQEFGHYIKSIFTASLSDGYPMLGEFFFRHYISNRQKNNLNGNSESKFELDEPIDGPYGEIIFAFSEKHKIPFQLHLEIEDRLLGGLEKMLNKYPGAIVIWCHVGRVRFSKLATRYNSHYVEELLKSHPNLYFDLSSTPITEKYYKSGEFVSKIWNRKKKILLPEWASLFRRYPWRFLSALDLGPDRMNQIQRRASEQRSLMADLPPETKRILSYKAAWKLLFNEVLEGKELN